MKVLELFSGTHSIGKVFDKKGYDVYSLDRDLGENCPFDTNYTSKKHFKVDIMEWDYKQFPEGFFDVITASPVCLWWSRLRNSWIGRKCKSMHPTDIITKEHIEEDINKYGKPMVDKVIEIIEYFKPEYWWIENPQTGRMKYYIEEKYPSYNTFYDVDYCKYSDFGYRKRTRFWTNIKGFEPQICKNDCESIIVIRTQEGDKRGKELIKKDTRTLHLSATCNERNLKSIRKAIKNKDVIMHKKGMGSKNNYQICVGGGNNRLERYRIPEKLIIEFVEKIEESEIVEE